MNGSAGRNSSFTGKKTPVDLREGPKCTRTGFLSRSLLANGAVTQGSWEWEELYRRSAASLGAHSAESAGDLQSRTESARPGPSASRTSDPALQWSGRGKAEIWLPEAQGRNPGKPAQALYRRERRTPGSRPKSRRSMRCLQPRSPAAWGAPGGRGECRGGDARGRAAGAVARARPLLPRLLKFAVEPAPAPGAPGHPALPADGKGRSRAEGPSNLLRRGLRNSAGRPGEGVPALELSHLQGPHPPASRPSRGPRGASLSGDPSRSAASPDSWVLCLGLPTGVHGETGPGRGRPLHGDDGGPTPAETKFNKFGQEVLELRWLGPALPLRVAPPAQSSAAPGGKRFCRGARSIRVEARGAQPLGSEPWSEGWGSECVISEQAPRPAGRVSKSAPLLCPSLALPPPPFAAPPPSPAS
nr:collagen alpha-1(I) chain-like [Saimiri boliviensis boliviensis]